MPALVNVIVSLTSPALWAVVLPEPSVVVAAGILPESLPAFGTWTLTVILPLAAGSEPVSAADFVRWMRLPGGRPPPLDYYGHDPFSRRFPNLRERPYFPGGRDINDIDTLEAQLRRTYHRQVPLWLSEFTVSSDHPNRAFDFAVSRKQQARWLTAAFRLANSASYVAGMGWFDS